MADVNLLLTENFYSVTSAELLAAPEPQYLYSIMHAAAMGAQFPSVDVDSALPAHRDIGSAGAPYAAAERDRLALASPLMNGVFVAKWDFAGEPGNMVRFNRPLFADTTYTLASREIGQNTAISTTTINAGSEQVSLELKRYAGPYDQANSRVAPFGIDRLAANMGVHQLKSYVGTHLRRDYHKFIDAAVVGLLDSASTVVYPSGMTANNDATVAGQFRLDYDTLVRAELAADAANLPVFPDGYRLLVITPTQAAQLKTDSDYMELSKWYPEMNALFPQYVSTIGKMHIFKSTSLTQGLNSSSVAIHQGHLICPGALLGGMGGLPRVAASNDDNYGEVAKLIWISYMALGLADNRFVISVRSSA